ncbi:hypothetical protein ACNKHS_14855 [Shigella flexneri]
MADYWYKFVGLKGAIVGVTGTGNLPRPISCSVLRFAENVVAKAREVLGVKGA